MTRELKLALILGFAIVLVVAVLLADHLSQARKARLADVAQTDADSLVMEPAGVMALTAGPTVTQAGPLAMAPVVLQHEVGESVASDPVALPSVVVTDPAAPVAGQPMGQATLAANTPTDDVTTLTQGPASGEDRDLLAAIQKVGGEMKGGIIRLSDTGLRNSQPAMQVRQEPTDGGNPAATRGTSGAPVLANPIGNQPSVKVVPVAPPMSTERYHTVAAGDSLYKIANTYYNAPNAWRKLADANAGVLGKGNELKVGMKIRIPSAESLGLASKATKAASKPEPKVAKVEPRKVESKPEAKKVKTYTVQKGDTLGTIAQKTLGSSKRADEILSANEATIEDEDSLQVGMVLVIPGR